MTRVEDIVAQFEGLTSMSPAGYAIGLHLSFTTSKYIFQTYSKEWMEEYSRRGLILSDPTVRWGLEHVGWIRWSELREVDPAGVIDAAAEFGLTFGVSISVADEDTRSLGSFAATKEEISEDVVAELTQRLREVHHLTRKIEHDSAEDKQIRRFAASLSGIELHDL
jgi:LuxR family transcriptional regulator